MAGSLVQRLVRACDQAEAAQVEEHGNPNARDSGPALRKVEAIAREMGMKSVDWRSGIFPIIGDKDGRTHYYPFDGLAYEEREAKKAAKSKK